MVKKLFFPLVLGIALCGACATVPLDSTQSFSPSPPIETATLALTPNPAATHTVAPTATGLAATEAECPRTHFLIDGQCLSYEEWLASRPRTMDAYGFEYDPSSKPGLPPSFSLCLSIWPGRGLPLTTIEGEPAFMARSAPESQLSAEENLRKVACVQGDGSDLQCQGDSPLNEFACESLLKIRGVYADIGPVKGLIARCGYSPPSLEESHEDYLYRVGAAFKQDIAYLFFVDGSLKLIKTPSELKELFSPISSPAEAINYAQLATGLVASYRLAPQPEFLYFYDPIDATRAEPTEAGYRLFLFHFTGCGCEPWVNSEVELLVDRDGTITWVGARPWSMTIGFSCAD
jgi:hypothetical protein